MDIYEYAMEMERDGENFYRELARKTPNKGLQSILTMLADAEVKHWKLFDNMKRNNKATMTETPLLDNVKNIFVQMKENKQTEADVSEIDLYRKAQEIERKSQDFYIQKAGEVDASQKEVFLKIADEEKKHFLILEKLIDFVDRPAYWLENPEWYHLENY
jgi:rubrerythrin